MLNEPLSRSWLRATFARRQIRHVVVDSAAWVVALIAGTLLRLDVNVDRIERHGLAVICVVAVACQVAAGGGLRLYSGRWRTGSFDEVAALVRAAMCTTSLVFIVDLFVASPRFVPLTATLMAGVIALVLMSGSRYLRRLAREARARPTGDNLVRIVVFGAGDAAAQVTMAMLRDPGSPYLPVAILDDDPHRQNLRISGVPVVGTREDIAAVARAHDASILLIAIPRAGSSLVADLSDRGRCAGLGVKVLPSTRELIDGSVGLGDIRDVTALDLLGRREIDTRVESVAGYLTGRRVLVTGAGGWIGSELCRQIDRFKPQQLLMLDHDESALHATLLSMGRRTLLHDGNVLLADVRDSTTMRGVFEQHRPDVVFHAAALKHLPLLERFPKEAVRTNVSATRTLLELAAEFGVDRLVNVSTDKAADPISVLGYTKRIAERLTAHVAREAPGTLLSVRFGNVLGSRGSVLDTFQAQIAAGGPVTVTHPEVVRFFMTTGEAVELVIQAGGIGRPGEVLVLDMGEPVFITDVAQRLAALAGARVDVEFTGLGPGEKLREVLFGPGEADVRPVHPLIAQVPVPPLSPEMLVFLEDAVEPDSVVSALRALCDVRPMPSPATAEPSGRGAAGAESGNGAPNVR